MLATRQDRLGAVDDRAALTILAAAADAGVNFLDTADVYGGIDADRVKCSVLLVGLYGRG
jgi:aryl-alcohol dehydrogenase-like predicted oxidoreductase